MNSSGATGKPPSPWTGSIHDRGHVLGGDLRHEGALEGLQRLGGQRPAVLLRERHPVDLGRERAEARLVGVRLRGQRERQQRAPVEAALERDHGGPPGVARANLIAFSTASVPALKNAAFRGRRSGVSSQSRSGERDVELVRDDREVRVAEAGELFLRGLDEPRGASDRC